VPPPGSTWRTAAAESDSDFGRPKRAASARDFLVDRNIAQRIVALLDKEPARVLEIGPGWGALTEILGERFGRVLALELDAGLAHELDRRFHGSSVTVAHADALHDPLEPLLAGEGPWQVASNLPYSVGTAILRRLLPRRPRDRMVVMLQRGRGPAGSPGPAGLLAPSARPTPARLPPCRRRSAPPEGSAGGGAPRPAPAAAPAELLQQALATAGVGSPQRKMRK
jgi:hypothetical protein